MRGYVRSKNRHVISLNIVMGHTLMSPIRYVICTFIAKRYKSSLFFYVGSWCFPIPGRPCHPLSQYIKQAGYDAARYDVLKLHYGWSRQMINSHVNI